MAEDTYSPSGYTIKNAVLKPFGSDKTVNITEIITRVSIVQSMNDISYKGYLEVLDNVGIIENLPIRGEEDLDLEIETGGVTTVLNLKLFVYSVDNIIADESGRSVMYNLNFITRTSFKAGTKNVLEAFSTSTYNIVKKIFEENFSKVRPSAETLSYETKRHPIVDDRNKNLFIQPGTPGKLECIIPDFLPGKAMNFISKRTYNENTPSQFFRFFETVEGFYFVTDEFLIADMADKPLGLFFTPSTGTLDPTDPDQQLNRIDTLTIASRGSNTGASIYNGSYVSQVKEIDLLRRRVVNKNFNYLKDANYSDMSGDKSRNTDAPHSKEFIEATFNIKNGMSLLFFKDHSSIEDNDGQLRSEQFFPEIAQNRLAYNNHANSVLLNVTLKGRADLIPGKIIELSISNLDVGSEVVQNAQLSGRYIIRSSGHLFDKGVLKTSLTLAKYNWSK